jgi:hypothetical protein
MGGRPLTAFRLTEISCDHADTPAPGEKWGRTCSAEFGAYKPVAAARREAAKEGWTHVRSPVSTRRYNFDKDYCPEHKPEPADTEAGQ